MRFFFFQAEDGIRDVAVTGVQTCALPICCGAGPIWDAREAARAGKVRCDAPAARECENRGSIGAWRNPPPARRPPRREPPPAGSGPSPLRLHEETVVRAALHGGGGGLRARGRPPREGGAAADRPRDRSPN